VVVDLVVVVVVSNYEVTKHTNQKSHGDIVWIKYDDLKMKNDFISVMGDLDTYRQYKTKLLTVVCQQQNLLYRTKLVDEDRSNKTLGIPISR